MNTIASNVANLNTTRNEQGEPIPFRRRIALLSSQLLPDGTTGVRVEKIIRDPSAFRQVFEPGHPDADAAGFVKYPNVDLALEMVDMMEASRAYEANVTMMETTKAMINSSLRLIA